MKQFLLQTIANLYRCKADPAVINQQVYKNTDCGAWIKFYERYIEVGTSVEGLEADYGETILMENIEENEDGAELLRHRVLDALETCEEIVRENSGKSRTVSYLNSII